MAKPSETWGRFEPVEETVPYRLIWRSYGAEKTGKDHFGLTAPGPIAIQSFDIGLEGVVEKFLKAPLGPKVIRFTEYEFDKSDCSKEAAEVLRNQFIEDFEVALKVARTIIWDTETEVWELFRTAELGVNDQGVATDRPTAYVRLNSQYRDLIQRAYNTGVNLQLIQKVKERWGVTKKQKASGQVIESPYATGVYEPTGFREAGYIVQANFEHLWDKERGFVLRCVNCRQNMELAGEEFTDTDFSTIAQLVFPESGEADWQ